MNDLTRVFSTGKGAYEKIISKIKLMQSQNFRVGAICVVNKYNINNVEELYSFFKNNNLDVKFNPLVKAGEAKENFENLGITSKEYSKFISKLFDLYNEDSINNGGTKIQIDPILESVGNILFDYVRGCRYLESCRD